MDARLGFLILGEGAILGVVLAGMGVLRVIREAGALKKRIEAYADLPLRSDFVLASRRVAIAERAVDSTVFLQARYDATMREFKAAGSGLYRDVREFVRAAREEYFI